MYKKRFTQSQFLNLWRLGNAIVLLSSLLSPWIVFWDDIDLYFLSDSTGFDILLNPLLGGSMLEALVPLIAIGYSIYCIFTFFNRMTEKSGIIKGSFLALFILVLTLYPLWYISYGIGFNTGLAWGYYVVIIGFTSSVFLELFSIFWTRYNPKDSVAI